MNDKLPTDLLVSAQIRTAARQGVVITVLNRGDNVSGTIILKINKLNGFFVVLNQIRIDDELVWARVGGNEHMAETDADAYVEKQIRIDSDTWVIEIEDREGRHWFPGRIVSL